MAMLIGAAQAMAMNPEFEGTVHFIFQPAEENVGGARMMIKEGLFDRFPCDMVFGLHNMPGIGLGTFSGKAGPVMSSIDAAQIKIKGKGGHGAQPEKTIDPILIGASLVTALQSIVARNINPAKPGVVTVGSFHSGSSSNIIPDEAVLEMSLRASDPESRAHIIERVKSLCSAVAQGFGGCAEIEWQTGYPVLSNHEKAFDTACQVVEKTFGLTSMQLLQAPAMASEDFAYMLEQVPGAFVFIGNGDSPSLHNTLYDFNDLAIPYGVKFYQALAETLFARSA
jgi:hippurate hydrolase